MKLAKITTLLALAAFLCAGVRLAWLAGDAARELPERADAAIAREAAATRQAAGEQIGNVLTVLNRQMNDLRLAANGQISDTRSALAEEAQGARRDALQAIDQTSGRAQKSIGDLRLDVSSHLTRMEKTLTDTATVTVPVKVIAERMQEVVEIGTDCESSPNCWQNASHSLVRAWKESAEGTAKALPEITASVVKVANEAPATAAALRGITEDAHTVTAEFVRPRRWHERLWAGIKAIGGVAVLAAK